MGSGNYPINKFDHYELHFKLLESIRTVRKAVNSIDYDDNQSDNAASDGWYRSRLSLALHLLEECVAGGDDEK